MERPKTVYLKEYCKSDYLISDVHLTFDLDDTKTRVKSILKIVSNHDLREGGENSSNPPLVLNGEHLKFLGAKLDGSDLKEGQYSLSDLDLTIFPVPANEFTLEVENEINPSENSALEGLYKSGPIFCTQNEPHGFRRITYFIDRPDVMSKFTTKIIANKKDYPILLSNGNPGASGDLEEGKHWVEWFDPFPKPAYLYALVAGDLGLVQDEFNSMSGRKIDLRIYCDPGNESRCGHAMDSLKKSMKWDEDTFGLEYDLDIYMIVAVDSFNMGAMENKGLNIFNSALVLAIPATATDENYQRIEGVVAHEYFHNWTGNRITCRDWFQLTLKEGLTVFRDQLFSSDINSSVSQRISDVIALKTMQFIEDGGPNAHPIKPDSYIEINNFYTNTVYDKGAEVIRMLYTFFGPEGFRAGMDKYRKLYDGKAITTEDFLKAMSLGNDNFDLTQFENWYHQAGTPVVKVEMDYDESEETLTMDINQSCPSTPGQAKDDRKPFHFPLKIGLIGESGADLPVVTNALSHRYGVFDIRNSSTTIVFEHLSQRPIVSINRGFSAPIKVDIPYGVSEYAFLLAHDTDDFNRFDAASQLVILLSKDLLKRYQAGAELELNQEYIGAYGKLLDDTSLNPSFRARVLKIPHEEILHLEQTQIDFEGTYHVTLFIKKSLARIFKDKFLKLYQDLYKKSEYSIDSKSIGERTLKNLALSFLSLLDDDSLKDLAQTQFNAATNMTDEISALENLVYNKSNHSENALRAFYNKWKHETLVIQKWLTIRAASPHEGTLEIVKILENDPIYDKTVPNMVKALLVNFSHNYVRFHDASGSGYEYIADKIIEIDTINPQVGSRLAGAFNCYPHALPDNQILIKEQLERIRETQGLSKNVFEIVDKILKTKVTL